jgi:hypothetical protein
MDGCFSGTFFSSPTSRRNGNSRGYTDDYSPDSDNTDEEGSYIRITSPSKAMAKPSKLRLTPTKQPPIEDIDDNKLIEELEGILKRRKSESELKEADKSSKLQELLIGMKEEISNSQIELEKLEADIVSREKIIFDLKAAASAAHIEYNANIVEFTLMVERLEQDVSTHVSRQKEVALAETDVHDNEISELRIKNKELATKCLLHQKEKEALRNVVTGVSFVADRKLESPVETDIFVRRSNSFNIDQKCARKSLRVVLPIKSDSPSRAISPSFTRSPKGDFRVFPIKTDSGAFLSAPSVRVPFMSPKKLLPYRNYNHDLSPKRLSQYRS